MVRQQLAVPRRNGRHRSFDGCIKSRDANGELVVVGIVVVGVCRIARYQSVAHDLRVPQGQNRVGPQVRVGVPALLGERKIELPLVPVDGLLSEAHD